MRPGSITGGSSPRPNRCLTTSAITTPSAAIAASFMRIVGRCKSFARIFAVTDSSCSRSVSETCPLTRSSSPSRISSASARSADDRGHHVQRRAPLAEPLDLRLDQPLGPRGLAPADGDGLRHDRLEVVDVAEVAALELPRSPGRCRAARPGRSAAAGGPSRAGRIAGDVGPRDDEPGRARGGDDDVDVAELSPRARRAGSTGRRTGGRAARRCSSVRFATTAISAPRDTRLCAVDALIFPAPSSSTRRPVRSSKTRCASAAAADGTEAGFWPIVVSTRTRRPARSASRNSRSRIGPAVPASCAARSWPRISPSPGTLESSPAATRNRWMPTASSRRRYRARDSASRRSPASVGQDLDGARLGIGVTGEVQLRAVARRDDDRVAAELLGDRAGAVDVERDALAQLDRRTVV